MQQLRSKFGVGVNVHRPVDVALNGAHHQFPVAPPQAARERRDARLRAGDGQRETRRP
jgi:hypothetical protein